jgi:hypothetical protein
LNSRAYHYDSQRRNCEPFIYDGCNGNANRFLTYDMCAATCGGPPPMHCSVDAADPSLPGVAIRLESERCSVPYGQPQSFYYRVTVVTPIQYTLADSGGSCGLCGPFTGDPDPLILRAVGEGAVRYTDRGGGCCPATTGQEAETLKAGTYVASIDWPGRQGYTSDTPVPLGPFFPQGSYAVTVALVVPGVGQVTATLPIEVVAQ